MVGGKGLGGGILGFICGIRALNKQKKKRSDRIQRC